MADHFSFLKSEWPAIYESAGRAEALANADPRAACFYARRTLELLMQWLFTHDRTLATPYQSNLSALVHEPTFCEAAGQVVFNKARMLIELGNDAVHKARPVMAREGISAVRELFHVCYWLARTYSRGIAPPPTLTFDPAALPTAGGESSKSLQQIQTLQEQAKAKDAAVNALLADKLTLDEKLKAAEAEMAAIKAANAAKTDTHDYNEQLTRDEFVDRYLKEAGWPLDQARDIEFEVSGMPSTAGKGSGVGFVDYVLWGDDGRPLAVVEAKRARGDANAGKQQAKLYADCLEQKYGRRPVIYYTNGYEHWLWDDAIYPPRAVQGFHKKDELEQMIQRRNTRKPLATAEINPAIVERYYQTRAIRRINESFEKDKQRKSLVVMATGSGKTRTVIALCDVLMKCNWAKRILFLADRVALVTQAVNNFKKHLPDASPVNLVTEKAATGRVYVSTYPTMMGLIDEKLGDADSRRFGIGHFDLIVIDEAHRSVYQKYRAIFEYFDAMLVGLTATPKDDIDHNTYGLFDLEKGVPTDSYTLEDAVKDGYLVPAKPLSVPLKFQRQGIAYDALSEAEKEAWDALEWDEEEGAPERIEPDAVNKWLFNQDTVDKVLKDLMTRGQTVAGGDRLGKTIIFAKNQDHANFICKRFDANYPHLKGEFASVITFQTKYAQSLIDSFQIKEKSPHIAISVDMLDTGIDVPEVVNLVFFKAVRSKTKFWQMIGRGTRLCPGLFGPGQDKQHFYIFDYCGNFEYFGGDPPEANAAAADSLARRLFKARLALINTLTARDGGVEGEDTVREEARQRLHEEVAAMNTDNFVVRPHRKLVEQLQNAEAWQNLDPDTTTALAENIAGLPTELPTEDEEAKRFDLLILNLQLAVLQAKSSFRKLKKETVQLMGALEEVQGVPAVNAELPLIQDMQEEAWWADMNVPILENARKRLRLLIKLIELQKREPLYTNFEDELGEATAITLPGFGSSTDHEKFLAKARAFLRSHQTDPAIAKLRTKQPLTGADVEALERIFVANGVASAAQLMAAAKDGLPVFVRSLVGMDRKTASQAMSTFAAGKTLTASQHEFMNLIVDHLVEHGLVERSQLFESPFTDISPQGPDHLFGANQTTELLTLIDGVNQIQFAGDASQ